MKTTRLFSVTLLVVLNVSFTLYGQQVLSPIAQADGVVTVKEMQQAKTMKKSAINPVAFKALQQGEKKGEFQNVTYTLAPNVKKLTTTEKSQLDMAQDGILNINKSANKFVPSPDYIYLDDESDLVFQPIQTSDDKMIMMTPKLYNIFENIEIPKQEVKMTLANTTEIAHGAKVSSNGNGDSYAVYLKFDSITYTLDSTTNAKFTATLIGEISLTNPRVEGRYSKNNGYSLVFKTSERVNLRVKTNIKASNEQKILLWGTEIPVKDIGVCELGVFAVVSISGEVTLVVDVNQGIDLGLGARGGTYYYVPTSIRNASYLNHFCEVDYDVKAKIKAFAGTQCGAKLKFKKYNILDVYAKGGMEGKVEADLKTLSADVGVRFKAGGKIVTKSFTFIDKYFSLWKLQKPDMVGYKMNVHEVCAFGDYVLGEVLKTEDGDNYTPYSGALKIVVEHPNGTRNKFDGQCTKDGLFFVKNIPLKKGDKAAIEIAGVSNLSPFMQATIPFKEINLTAVDYFTNTAYGSVSASKSHWYKLATQSEAAQNQKPINPAIAGAASKNKVTNVAGISQSEILKKINEFKNNLITYKGEIKFITQTTPTLSISNNGNAQKGTPPVNEKQRENKGYIDGAMDFFEVGNLDFAPNQKIKAQINLEGFTIESDWVETDGLSVSEIISEGLKSSRNLGAETIEAANSFVIVSALRAENNPTGNVRMLQGADMPHLPVNNKQAVEEFPEAKSAIVFIDKTVPLAPATDQQGVSIAQTGAWKSVVSSSPGVFLVPSKNGRHPFEKVSYLFENQDLGFEYFIDECHSCRSAENVIDRIQVLQNVRSTGRLQNINKKLMKQTPKINPKMGGTSLR